MATYTAIDQFVEDLAHKIHDLESDDLKVMLSLSAPLVTNTVRANVTQISAGDGYTTDGESSAQTVFAQTAGDYKLTLTDIVWTATAGTFANFRYSTLYNETSATPLDPLISFWDYGSTIDLGAGETFTWDQDGAGNGVLRLLSP